MSFRIFEWCQHQEWQMNFIYLADADTNSEKRIIGPIYAKKKPFNLQEKCQFSKSLGYCRAPSGDVGSYRITLDCNIRYIKHWILILIYYFLANTYRFLAGNWKLLLLILLCFRYNIHLYDAHIIIVLQYLQLLQV